jgi:hypothetical protein
MDCGEFALRLDDWLDGRLTAAERQSLQLHAEGCARCGRRHRDAEALKSELRMLPAPELRAGFLERALARAAGAPRAGGSRWMPGLALAASVAMVAVAAAILYAVRPDPVPTVVLTARQPGSVQLLFNAARPLPGATLSIALPENVEIVGYGMRRDLTWKTDLREGGNLLQLPLVVHGAAGGELVARVSRGASSKTFRLKILVRGTDAGSELRGVREAVST